MKRVNRPHYKPGGQKKITSHDASLIRELIGHGLRHRDIAEKFDVSRSTVTHIATGRLWASNKLERA